MPHQLSLKIKIPFTVFMLVFIPAYWFYRGPQNYLWGCDIALFLTLVALWRESSLPASMAILVTLIPDIVWILDLIFRLAGSDLLGISATAYMLDENFPLLIRLLSLFHIFLAPLLLWIIYQLGYDRRALLWQMLLTIIVLPVSYYFTDPERNINWAHGLGTMTPPWTGGLVHVAMVVILITVIAYMPTHLLMKRFFQKF